MAISVETKSRLALMNISKGKVALPLLAFLLFWGVAIAFQIAGHAYHCELNVESDDPAHYVTGLMLHDWAKSGFAWPPTQFAENYYAHYPKVALGHWPPVFYVMQAVWMLAFGSSIDSDLVLMSVLNGLLSTTLFFVVARQVRSWWAGAAVALLLIANPVVQLFTGTVMADLVVGVFCFWAMVAWSRYWEDGLRQSAMVFGVLSAIAIMTKGNGYALVLLPPIAIFIARRFNMIRDRSLWIAVGLMAALCAPWSLLTRELVLNSMEYRLTTAFFLQANVFYVEQLFTQMGLAAGAAAVFGLFVVLRRAWQGKAVDGIWVASAAWLLAFLLFHSLVPAALAPRYTIPAVPAWLLLMSYGVQQAAGLVKIPRWSAQRRMAALGGLIGLAFVSTAFSIPQRVTYGYVALARDLAKQPQYDKRVILVSSQGDGEGMLVAEVAQWDQPRPRHIILRAGRALADSDWLQRNYVLRYRTSDELMTYLESVPVGVIVIDRIGHHHPNQHQPLLEQVLQQHPDQWKLSGTYPEGAPANQSLAVYRLDGPNAIATHPISLEVNGTMHKTIEIKP